MPMMTSAAITAIAKQIRTTLRAAPELSTFKFSVRMKTYDGSISVAITWIETGGHRSDCWTEDLLPRLRPIVEPFLLAAKDHQTFRDQIILWFKTESALERLNREEGTSCR